MWQLWPSNYVCVEIALLEPIVERMPSLSLFDISVKPIIFVPEKQVPNSTEDDDSDVPVFKWYNLFWPDIRESTKV